MSNKISKECHRKIRISKKCKKKTLETFRNIIIFMWTYVKIYLKMSDWYLKNF